jgi:hypothetical protein
VGSRSDAKVDLDWAKSPAGSAAAQSDATGYRLHPVALDQDILADDHPRTQEVDREVLDQDTAADCRSGARDTPDYRLDVLEYPVIHLVRSDVPEFPVKPG